MEKVEYPKWLYQAGSEPKLVTSKAEHEALGSGWSDSPAHAEHAPAPAKKAHKKPEAKA